jgi:hypothetical protein
VQGYPFANWDTTVPSGSTLPSKSLVSLWFQLSQIGISCRWIELLFDSWRVPRSRRSPRCAPPTTGWPPSGWTR